MELLDRIYREKIGAETYDMLLERGVHFQLFADGAAYGRMGGWQAHEDGPAARCLVGHGATAVEAARSLMEGSAAAYHAPNLKTSLWALGEACELLADAARARGIL